MGASGIEQPRKEAELLLAHLLGKERLWLITAGNRELSAPELASFKEMLIKRQARMPIAYIIGHCFFRDHLFQVSPHVLIPRPETEELVEHGLKAAPPPGGAVVDLGCGSGCIGITILKERPDLHLHFSDISEAALSTCRHNLDRLAPEQRDNCSFYLSDLFAAFPQSFFQKRQIDLIFSNLPYIFPHEWNSLAADISLYEPKEALLSDDPAQLYAKAIAQSAQLLKQEATLLLELSPTLANHCLEIGKRYFRQAELIPDMAGKLRFLYCHKPC